MIVPLISGGARGPLGLAGLPRLWFALRTNQSADAGDAALCATIGIERATLASLVAAEAPDYLAFEAAVRRLAPQLTPAHVAAHNAALDAAAIARADRAAWDAVHAQIASGDGAPAAIVPAIGTDVTGARGVVHLPRLWLKHRLFAAGRLPADYRHGPGGMDEMLTDALGIDRFAFAAAIERDALDEAGAEAWVRAHATNCTAEAIAAINERLRTIERPEPAATERRALLGITDPSFALAIPLNDLDDWLTLHHQLAGSGP